MLGVGSKDPDVAPGEVKQEPSRLEDMSPGTSTQLDYVDATEKPDSGLIGQIHEMFDKNAKTMSQIAKLNTAKSELSMAQLTKEMAKNNNEMTKEMAKNKNEIDDKLTRNNDVTNENMANLNDKLTKNNDKLDEFQNLVITLNKTVTSLEIKVSKHNTDILECKSKVTQITMDYIKKEELS